MANLVIRIADSNTRAEADIFGGDAKVQRLVDLYTVWKLGEAAADALSAQERQQWVTNELGRALRDGARAGRERLLTERARKQADEEEPL